MTWPDRSVTPASYTLNRMLMIWAMATTGMLNMASTARSQVTERKRRMPVPLADGLPRPGPVETEWCDIVAHLQAPIRSFSVQQSANGLLPEAGEELPLPENRRADADMSRPKLNGNSEVSAHSHG